MKKGVTNIFSKRISTIAILIILVIIDFFFQYYIRHLSLSDSIKLAFLDAPIYTGILWLTMRLDLARVTLCFLALPYLIFIPGWLNLPTAILLLTIFIYCIFNVLPHVTANSYQTITWRDFFAFLLILIWVNISGAGGYGFQWDDYGVNNARLHDLVTIEWPIRYGENQNFVYYFGYFLPAAVIGKIFSVNVAIHSMYAWTALGVTLAVRWLAYLSRWRFSIALVFIFILFGPIDLLNIIYINRHANISWIDIQSFVWSGNTHQLDFATGYEIGFFLGNYLSNVFNLYWSPQQIIAGWLCAGLMMHLFLQRKMKSIVFIYALLSLWGPLVMIALFPFVLLAIASQLLSKNWRNIISLENTLGAGSLAGVFVIFYLGGSSTANPSFWLLSSVDWSTQWDVLVVFYLAAWGIYALALIAFILKTDIRSRIWFSFLILALTILPLRIFGEWSDLLCRGSAPLMFLLLIFLLRAVHHYWHNNQRLFSAILLCLLIAGAGSAILINRVSLQNYGRTQPVTGLLSYSNAYPNFGPDNSFFNHLFRHPLIVK